MKISIDKKTGNAYDQETGRRVISPVFTPRYYERRRRIGNPHAGTVLAVLLIGGWLGAAAVTYGRTWEAAAAFAVMLLVLLGLFWPRND